MRQLSQGSEMTLAAETHLDPASRYGLIALAIVQGYALYFLHLALDQTVWPATDVSWLKALYTAAIGLPVFFYLGMERLKDRLPTLVAGYHDMPARHRTLRDAVWHPEIRVTIGLCTS